MIHISSTSVYGTSNSLVNEYSDNKDINPQSPYAKTKVKEEKYLSSLEKKGLRFITLRFSDLNLLIMSSWDFLFVHKIFNSTNNDLINF